MKVYTKTGDTGQTSLLSNERVYKDSIRVQAYGTVDEANAAMGLAKALTDKKWAGQIIHQLQQELVLLNADLATSEAVGPKSGRITASHVEKLEQVIDRLEERRIPQKYFVTPGGDTAGAALDLARTIVRRAERLVVTLERQELVVGSAPLYLNRLSDLLFVLARCVEQEELVAEVTRQICKEVTQEVCQEEKSMKMPFLTAAKRMADAARQQALQMGIPMVIAIVDSGGNLILHERMDHSLLASISLALDKAYTAVALRMPTEQAARAALPGQDIYGINTTNQGRLVIFGGGLPIYHQNTLFGGIGVSGGSVEEDILVAKAGLAAFKEEKQ